MSPEPAAVAPTDVEAWGEVLTELSTLIEEAVPGASEESVSRLAAWTPPTGLGPLPAGLATWAQALERQAQTRAQELRAAIAANRAQDKVAKAVPTNRPSDASAYLDIKA